MISTRQGQSYAVLAGTLLLVIVLFGFGVYPLVSSIVYENEQNTIRQENLNKMEQKLSTLRQLIAEDQAKKSVSVALQSVFPDDVSQVNLIQDVTDTAKTDGVVIFSFGFGDLDTKRELDKIFSTKNPLTAKTLNMAVVGSRSEIETFIADLENMRRIVNITSMSIGKNIDEPTANRDPFRLDFQAEVYYAQKAATSGEQQQSSSTESTTVQ